jgi:hypothetical protein
MLGRVLRPWRFGATPLGDDGTKVPAVSAPVEGQKRAAAELMSAQLLRDIGSQNGSQ